ncbi:hypothetical protein P9J64_13565 [Deltaproteobacteria bacterium IMCC39524]|nr:hypothetical protein [Deltaproteobacteria bacterium IMCC39524]
MNKKSKTENEQIDVNEKNLAANALMAFKDRFETICKHRQEWEQTVFSTANKSLYEMLADLYKLYDEMNSEDKATEMKRAWLVKEAKRREIIFKRNKPSLIELLVKVAFTSTQKDSKRVSSYVRVLNVIANTEGVYAADIPLWIEEQGGIEEIRQQTAKKTATRSERIERGKEIVASVDTLASVTIDSAYASGNVNKPVVLVGIMNASGVIDIKHLCVEEDEKTKISGKSAISAALANVYSTHNAKHKNDDLKQKAEESADDSVDNRQKVLDLLAQVKGDKQTLAA